MKSEVIYEDINGFIINKVRENANNVLSAGLMTDVNVLVTFIPMKYRLKWIFLYYETISSLWVIPFKLFDLYI